MKIIEALKEMPLLEKRVAKNIELIQRYSSELDLGRGEFTFGSKEKQTTEVAGLVQSTNDLIARKAQLRKSLAITNATVIVPIGPFNRTITEWIEYREKGIQLQVNALGSLNDNTANTAIRTVQVDLNTGVRLVRFYDEKQKNERINELMETKSKIDSQLEIINAITDLIE